MLKSFLVFIKMVIKVVMVAHDSRPIDFKGAVGLSIFLLMSLFEAKVSILFSSKWFKSLIFYS